MAVSDFHASDYFQWSDVFIDHFRLSNDCRKVFKKTKEERILFAGRNAEAEIISVSQTGLTVNDQPQIMFQVSFKDFKGKEHITVFKKIVNLLDLASVPRQGKIEIMYDENNPSKITIPRMN